ncbi:MAG: glycosyltransferase [Candidatus Kapaibacterium sp.]
MKIALIGPAYPYRGGIAHHTNLLARVLRKRGHEVDVITFKRQYPKFLYPGAFQEEGGEVFADIESERLIDSMNPLNWLSVGRELRSRGYDLYVFRFWIPLFAPVFGTIARSVGGKRSGKVLMILDNLIPHEKRFGDKLFTQYQFRYCTKAISQSSTVSKQFKERFPTIPETMLPHPVYEHFGDPIPKEDARKALQVENRPTLLFFGFVRRYKGLDLLLEGMPAILEHVPEAQLLVVGEFFGDPKPYFDIIERHGLGTRVMVYDKFVPNEEVTKWFSASDLLVLPYRSATNSGIVQIGYNFALPSVVTDVGSLSEVVIDGVTGYVVEKAEPDMIAEAVEKAFLPGAAERLREGIIEERKKYSWEAFAEGLEKFVGEGWSR